MTTFALAPVARQLFLNPSNGAPASGFLLYTYAAGTTTKLATYVDSTGTVPNVNPIVMDALGECDIWLPVNTAYKFVFSPPTDTDPPTNAIWTRDEIQTFDPATQNPTVPTITKLLSGSGVYTPPAGCVWLEIEMVGGGGGGGGSGTGGGTAATAGTTTSFGTSLLTATGGAGGVINGATPVGGATTINSPAIGMGWAGANGVGSPATVLGAALSGNIGGASPFGGAGAPLNYSGTGGMFPNGGTNTGSGGAGAGGVPQSNTPFLTGTSGAAGGYIEAIIPSPLAANYAYSIGAGGVAGAGGTGNGSSGANGGSGVIVITEKYNF